VVNSAFRHLRHDHDLTRRSPTVNVKASVKSSSQQPDSATSDGLSITRHVTQQVSDRVTSKLRQTGGGSTVSATKLNTRRLDDADSSSVVKAHSGRYRIVFFRQLQKWAAQNTEQN